MKVLRRFAFLTCVAVLLLQSSACTQSLITPGPEQAVRDWYAALGDFDVPRLYALTAPERRDRLEADLRDPLVVASSALGLAKQQYFDLKCVPTPGEGRLTTVRVTGKVLGPLRVIEPVDDTLQLVFVNGRWLVWSATGWF
jgi:hypothetical protein